MNKKSTRHDIFSSFDTVIEGVELLRGTIKSEKKNELDEIENILNLILIQANKGKNNFTEFLNQQER